MIREEKFLKLKKDIPIQKQKGSIHSMDSCLAIFITVLFTITRKQKQAQCPITDEWTMKMWYICTMKYYLPIKKMKS